MYATIEPDHATLQATRAGVHPHCVVCGRPAPAGLGRKFRLLGDGGVTATFERAAEFAGYTGVLHGGVIAALGAAVFSGGPGGVEADEIGLATVRDLGRRGAALATRPAGAPEPPTAS